MISEMLTRIRKQHKLTMKDVAEAIGLKPDTYRNYESGRLEPNLNTLTKLAKFYNVTTDYLLGIGPPPDPISQLTNEELEQKLIEGYFKMPKEAREIFVQGLRKAVAECYGTTVEEIEKRFAPKSNNKISADRVPDNTNIVTSAAEPKDKYHDLLKKSGAEMTDEEIELTAELYKKGLREEKEALS